MEANRKKVLLEKFFNDECSPIELEELLTFIRYSDSEDPEVDKAVEKVFERLQNTHHLAATKSDIIFEKIVASEPDNRRLKVSFSLILKVAAAFIGVLIVSVFVYQFHSESYTSLSTAYGETKELFLPDGSKVILNANSIISYKKDWHNDEDREVELTGEAFFEVTHKTNNQKFVVKTAELDVEVLGTAFNVLSRKSRSMVLLNSGKVRLDIKKQKELIMIPGEMVELNTKSHTIKKTFVKPEAYTSWKKKILTFESTSITEIARILEDNYGLKIIIQDKKLADEKFTGTFPVDEDINLLLKMLSKANKFKIVEKDGYMIFK